MAKILVLDADHKMNLNDIGRNFRRAMLALSARKPIVKPIDHHSDILKAMPYLGHLKPGYVCCDLNGWYWASIRPMYDGEYWDNILNLTADEVEWSHLKCFDMPEVEQVNHIVCCYTVEEIEKYQAAQIRNNT